MSLEVIQPVTLKLDSLIQGEESGSTSVTLIAHFEPTSNVNRPPSLDSVKLALEACTFYACAPQWDMSKRECADHVDSLAGWSSCTVSLPAYSIQNVRWEMSSHARDSSHEDGKCKSSYDVTLRIPVVLPREKTFVPSFSSCLVSRVYSLTIRLYLSRVSGLLGSCLELTVPLQVVCGRGEDSAALRRDGRTQHDSPAVGEETWESSGQSWISEMMGREDGEEKLPAYHS